VVQAIIPKLKRRRLPIRRLTFAAAALTAAMGFDMRASHAAWREEPWCAVIEYDADVTWDCSYRTFEECYPNVLAGNKGFCSPSPAGPGPAASAAPRKPRKRHAQR
jgi:hypothetical protein